MSQLITDKEQPLHRAQPGDSLSTVARARTLTVLTTLGGARKGMILDFLYTSGLITNKNPIVLLDRAHLAQVGYLAANLKRANLAGANLIEANLGVAVFDTASNPQIP